MRSSLNILTLNDMTPLTALLKCSDYKTQVENLMEKESNSDVKLKEQEIDIERIKTELEEVKISRSQVCSANFPWHLNFIK